MTLPTKILDKNKSILSLFCVNSLTFIDVADDCVALFHIICPDNGSPVVILVFA